MTESRAPAIVLGVAAGTGLKQIAEAAAGEVECLEGAALSIFGVSGEFELRFERPSTEQPFSNFLLTLPRDHGKADAWRALVQSQAQVASLHEADGRCELTIQAADGQECSDIDSLLDELSSLLELPETWRFHGENFAEARLSPGELFHDMQQFEASDAHLFPGTGAVFRTPDNLIWTDPEHSLSARQILALIKGIAPDFAWRQFCEHGQTSFGYHQIGHGHSRVSVFRKGGAPHCTVRFLAKQIPSFDDLHFPAERMQRLAGLLDGLVLVSGMTGSGKSTTVAAMIDWINRNRGHHILTIEEPIEYVHENRQSMVSQREVGVDVESFSSAVRAGLRHDPNVVFVGEMRDTDTIRAVIDAAATGHLVISTLHASRASDVASRVVSFFDPSERDLVRLQLHDCLRCVINQRLVPRVGGGRIPALEFLFNDTKKISDSILSGDSRMTRIGMQQELSESQVYEETLLVLQRAGEITEETADQYAPHPETLQQMRLGTWRPPSVERLNQPLE